MTPLLILVFGISPVTAIGTDIFYAAITKTVGGFKHLRLKTVHRGIAFWMAIGSVPSAIAGVWVIELLQQSYGEDLDKLVLGMLGGALLVVGIATLLRSLFFRDVIAERSSLHLYRRHIIAAIVTGVTTGFVIGLTSAGSGTLIAIALIAIFQLLPASGGHRRVPRRRPALGGGMAHWVGGNIDFALAGNILSGSIPGVIVGANLSVKAPQSFLRIALGVVLIAHRYHAHRQGGRPQRRRPRDRDRDADDGRAVRGSDHLPLPRDREQGRTGERAVYAADHGLRAQPARNRASGPRPGVHRRARPPRRARGASCTRRGGSAGAGVAYPGIIRELRERAKADGLWNLFLPDDRFGPGLTRLGVRGPLRGDGPLARDRAHGVQLRRARHRQHGDPRRARHARAAGALAQPAARRRDPLVLLDDRARRLGVGPNHSADPGGPRW